MAAKKGGSGKKKGGAKKKTTRPQLRVVPNTGQSAMETGAGGSGASGPRVGSVPEDAPLVPPDNDLISVAHPRMNMPRNIPGIAYRSPLLPPIPQPGEETMFDMQQLVHGKSFESIDEINRELQKFTTGGPVPRSEPTEPGAKAQRLMYTAWFGDPEDGLELAHKALAIDPDCTDAYLLQAFYHSDDPGEALRLARLAIEAGERTLEADGILDDPEVTDLWGHLPSRPLLRARLFLARMLWGLGSRISATDVAERSLDLDQNDALGVRYLLMSWYLNMGEEWFSRHLFNRYKDDPSAVWLYADALLTFFERGDDRTSKARLNKALKANALAADLLLDEPPDPFEGLLIESYGPGSESEAMICALLLFSGWDRDETALDWLTDGLERKKKRESKKQRD